MNSRDISVSLRNGLQKFRKTPWFRVTYLVLLGLIVSQLYPLTASSVLFCLGVLLMPLLVFVVPYWLGERKARRLGVNALPVFLIAILIVGAISTQSLLSLDRATPIQSFPDFQSNPTMALSNGTVTPYRADPSTTFTFRVKLTTTANATPAAYAVYVNLTVVSGLSATNLPAQPMAYSPGAGSANNTKNGTWYETRMNVGDAIYGYGFSVWNRRGNWTLAGPDFGPLTASTATYYGFWVFVTAFQMILPFTFYYLILFMWWYTVRAREMRTRMLPGELEIPKEKKPPSKPEPESGEKAAKAAAFTCTNCGADVDETAEKCPKCGAVFED